MGAHAAVVCLVAAVASLSVCDAAQAGDRECFESQLRDIKKCIGQLSSGLRAEEHLAVNEIAQIGLPAIRVVAREGGSLGGEAWTVFSRACDAACRQSAEPSGVAIELVAAAHLAAGPHRSRLLALAQQFDATAGRPLSRDAVDAKVREYLLVRAQLGCTTGNEIPVALLGHDAVPAVLRLIHEPGFDRLSAFRAIEYLAAPDDVPALRRVLLDGETLAAIPLRRVHEQGVEAAEAALVEAVLRGLLDADIAWALATVRDRDQALQAMRRWSSHEAGAAESQRAAFADLAASLDAYEFVQTLERWVLDAVSPYYFTTVVSALVHLGSTRGVELAVRMICDPQSAGPDLGSDHAPERASISGVRTQRRIPRDIRVFQRLAAARMVADIAGPDAGIVDTREAMAVAASGASDAKCRQLLEGAAEAAHVWWEAARVQLVFDPQAGTWSMAR